MLDEGFRYRDLDTGSFITKDPLGFIDGPNVYTYVNQNPWTKFDPEGLATEDDYKADQKKATQWYVQATKAAGADKAKQKSAEETYNKWIAADQKGIDHIEATAKHMRDVADKMAWFGIDKKQQYEAAAHLDDSTDLFKAESATATMQEVQETGFLMVVTDGAGQAVGGIFKWIKGAEAVAPAVDATEEAVRFHHSWPKYLGGNPDQILEPLPKALHDAYHSGLDKILPRQASKAYYDSLGPAARTQMIQDLAHYTKAFDAKYGTHLYEGMVREGFPH